MPERAGDPHPALGLRDADDDAIFRAAAAAGAAVMTKDGDFLHLLQRLGPPPRIIWLRSGNTSNAVLQRLIEAHAVDLRAWWSGPDALIEVR